MPYAEVIGDPIAHSKSPLIHKFWLDKLGLEGDYRRRHVRAEGLTDYFTARRADPDWRGCNVTVPHKKAVMTLLERVEQCAAEVGAANTIVPEAGLLIGFNTDVDGILAALPPSLMKPGAEVCLFGTGGAARSALAACRRRDVSLILLSARDQAEGRRLLSEFDFGGSVGPLDDAHNIATAEVIINATSLGMVGQASMPRKVLEHLVDPMPAAVVLDMVYAPLDTPLLRAARAGGCRTIDGLQMLVGQAAAAFEMFFDQPAPREHDAELRALLVA